MNLKNTLKENIVTPVAMSHSSMFLDAVVKETNEKTNTCTVVYINQEGVELTQKSVPVQIQNVGIIDWFPKEKEHVIVTKKGGGLTITGPSYGKSYSTIRNQLELTEDIYSDTSDYTMGGFIF